MQLMADYCAGDSEAFHQLYAFFAPKLLGYLRSLCRRPALADDLLQQTFLKVHRARGQYITGAHPRPWMYAIAHRTFIDETRKESRARAKIAKAKNEIPTTSDISGTSVENKTEPLDSVRVEAVLGALNNLPANQRQAVSLTKLQGKSLKEAAEISGTTVGAIKLRVHRGYTSLRRALRNDGSQSHEK